MNIILAEPEEVKDRILTVIDRRAEHIVKVLRAEVGNQVRVGIINGELGTGKITGIKKKYPFCVELALEFLEMSAKKPMLDLILALPRPIMLKRILSQVAALGVGTIHLINANRVEKSFWEAGILHPDEYRRHLLQGLEQAVDTRVPQIQIHQKFKPFIEDYFPTVAEKYRCILVAHPDGGERLAGEIDSSGGPVVLAVGPEGGWVDYEIMKFQDQGFSICSLGERILKVDTAVVALYSRISAIQEIREAEGR